MKQRSDNFYGGLILAQTILLGIGNPVAKYGMESFPFFLYVSIRFLTGCLFLVLVFHRQIKKGLKRDFWIPATIIAIFTASTYILGTLSFRYTTATNAGFLFAMPVVVTPFLTRIVSKSKVNAKRYVPIVVVVCGLYFLCCQGGKFRLGFGEILAALSAFLVACMLEFTAHYTDRLNPLLLAAYQAGFTGVVCLVLSLLNGEKLPIFSTVPASAWGALLYLAIACTGISYCFQNSALQKIDSTKAALIMCSQPVFTAASSFFLLGERMTWIGMLGAVIIMAGICWASVIPDSKESD